MKTIWKIVITIAILSVVLLVSIRFYVNDARLRSWILPELRATTGTEVTIDHLSLTWLQTFPHLGVSLDSLVVPSPSGDTVFVAHQITTSIGLFPLLNDQILLHEVSLESPQLVYRLDEDGSSNIDFLLTDEEPEQPETETGYGILMPSITLKNAHLYYTDQQSGQEMTFANLSGDIAFAMNDQIETQLDLILDGLTVKQDERYLVRNLPLQLNQQLNIDTASEEISLSEGTVTLAGVQINLNGTITGYRGDAPELNLTLASASDDFGELLTWIPQDLIPEMELWESRGRLNLLGTIQGAYTETTLPQIELLFQVQDGYLKHKELPDAIKDIQIVLQATNQRIQLDELQLQAGGNTLRASGQIDQPLDEGQVFQLQMDSDIDLNTVDRFYPISTLGVEELAGTWQASVQMDGQYNQLHEVAYQGQIVLKDGRLKYQDVDEPIERITANINLDGNTVQIEQLEMHAANNSVVISGQVWDPMDTEKRGMAVNTKVMGNLSTVKQFYPIDEDTLSLSGLVQADLLWEGPMDMDRLDKIAHKGTVSLREGKINYPRYGPPIETLEFDAELAAHRLIIQTSNIVSGKNHLEISGQVQDYWSSDPVFDLNIIGDADLHELATIYSLEPYIQQQEGMANINLHASGSWNNLSALSLEGSSRLTNVMIAGDSLWLPITNLQTQLRLEPNVAQLVNFSMNMGQSDYTLEGNVEHYISLVDAFAATEAEAGPRPKYTGIFRSNRVDLDELMDWDADVDAESTDESILVELPDIEMTIEVDIREMKFMGLVIQDIQGQTQITQDQIRAPEASANWFDGSITGDIQWDIPQPNRTQLSFNGTLSDLKVNQFFKETKFLGRVSNIHKYVDGAFSTQITYSSELDATLTPEIASIEASGTLGMSKARLKDHPIQLQLAELLNSEELENLAMDEWQATYTISQSVLALDDFQLSSGNIGMRMEGTQHLLTDQIDYKATILLPEQFKKGLAAVISDQGVKALQSEEGIIEVPVQITGTMEKPTVKPDDTLVQKAIEDYLKKQGRKLLDRIKSD
ncbi:MAG: AsmA-like C-terminal region-containing protein [Bacteroidota bacterium]